MQKDYQDEMPLSRCFDLMNIIKSKNSDLYITKNPKGQILGYSVLEYCNKREFSYLSKIKGIEIDKNGYIRRDYTFLKYRGHGLHKFSIIKRLQLLKYKSFYTCTTRIAIQNYISNKNYQKLGFEKYLLEIEFHFFHKIKNNNKLFIYLRQNV